MKKIVSMALAVVLAAGFAGCGEKREVLKVYNVGMYIDKSTIRDFEKEYGIKVVYDEYNTNEEMYAKVSKDENAYDVVLASDYTIDHLIQEGRLAQLNKEAMPNFANIAEIYLAPSYDLNNDYSVPYMVGTLGILYNKNMVKEVPTSWNAMWDEDYAGEIFMWDSMRDAMGVALKAEGFSMNSDNEEELEIVKNKLIAQKPLLQAYVGDETKDKMVAEEGALALLYSGDAKVAIDENPNLGYVIPDEGSNKWVDAWAVMKNTQHLDAAQKFIDFMCRPEIAMRNMEETGYTSPVEEIWQEFGENPVMFPTEEELNRCEAFLYSDKTTKRYSEIWTEVRAR